MTLSFHPTAVQNSLFDKENDLAGVAFDLFAFHIRFNKGLAQQCVCVCERFRNANKNEHANQMMYFDQVWDQNKMPPRQWQWIKML